MKTIRTTFTLRPYMLWLKNALMLFLLLFCGPMANAQTSCHAGFTYTANYGTYTFTNTSTTSSGNPLIYYWNFGDGDSYDENPVHVYEASGYYPVSLTIKDTLGNCRSSIVDSVHVTGICNADFSTSNTDLTAYFSPRTVETGVTYQWTFGDGSSSTSTYPNHTYTNAGSYQVCLVINNSNSNCSDTVCRNIAVTTPKYCKSDFISYVSKYTATFMADSVFTGYSTATYSWNFGDNTTSTEKSYVQHTYSDTGFYLVSLTVTHDSCTSTAYDSVIIHAPGPPQNGDISGFVYLNNSARADAGKAYLIKVDYSDTSLALVDTVDLVMNDTLAMYAFRNIPGGTYYVKAALTTASSYYNDYLPTYGADALMWKDATPIDIDGNYIQQLIIMNAGLNPGGPGFIGGKVSEGANKKEGDPLKDIEVILFNENDKPVTYTYTDINGNFKFENLAFGNYKVYTEVPGLVTLPGYASISAAKPKVENIEVKVSSDGVTTGIFTKVSEDFVSTPKLYPNPAKNALYLETNLRKSQNTNIVIYNVTGQQVYSENISLLQGKQTQLIDIDKLPSGLYMLSVKNASGTDEIRYKFVKTE